DTLPPTARSIALLLASTPSVQDAQPGVLHQLLEFSHRYTQQVLTDAIVYSEHAGRSGKIEMDDVMLAVQARVGWEFGGRIPKEYMLSLAAQTNAQPLPAVPEVFGIRLPQSSDCLTSVNFDLIPNKPPPDLKQYDEEVEEIEESESESELEEAQPEVPQSAAMPPPPPVSYPTAEQEPMQEDTPFPVSALATPSEMDIFTPARHNPGVDEGSEAEEDDGLFAGGDDDDSDAAMEEVQPAVNGVKRKLVEEDDYD
ncbi:TFIID-31kDa-domain-containing protein, partial [Fistulina hepatica ATCC 64428]